MKLRSRFSTLEKVGWKRTRGGSGVRGQHLAVLQPFPRIDCRIDTPNSVFSSEKFRCLNSTREQRIGNQTTQTDNGTNIAQTNSASHTAFSNLCYTCFTKTNIEEQPNVKTRGIKLNLKHTFATSAYPYSRVTIIPSIM